MQNYVHKVNYYETDKMGVVHHSNYIRWMEEARSYYLNQIGFGYKKMEEEGVVSPVISLECSYLKPTKFDDEVEIVATILSYNSVKLAMGYTMKNVKTGEIVLKGTTSHCFLNTAARPQSLKKYCLV